MFFHFHDTDSLFHVTAVLKDVIIDEDLIRTNMTKKLTGQRVMVDKDGLV